MYGTYSKVILYTVKRSTITHSKEARKIVFFFWEMADSKNQSFSKSPILKKILWKFYGLVLGSVGLIDVILDFASREISRDP